MEMLAGIRGWGTRRQLAAFAAGVGWLLLSAVPTDILNTPLLVRMTSVEWWNYPFWVAGAVLVGLLAATYVSDSGSEPSDGAQTKKVLGSGFLSVVAIGCPVCNKLVVLAIGTSGALAYFVPVQSLLGLLSIGLLLHALPARVASERSSSCAPESRQGRTI